MSYVIVKHEWWVAKTLKANKIAPKYGTAKLDEWFEEKKKYQWYEYGWRYGSYVIIVELQSLIAFRPDA